jgi:hypothetical protein
MVPRYRNRAAELGRAITAEDGPAEAVRILEGIRTRQDVP